MYFFHILFAVNILGDEKLYIKTSRGVILRRLLLPNIQSQCLNMLPSDTGSRIGMMYVQNPNDVNKAEMHFIVNGQDHGACARDIPYIERDLFAVIDVYGTTKQVKIIQVYESKFSINCFLRIIIMDDNLMVFLQIAFFFFSCNATGSMLQCNFITF